MSTTLSTQAMVAELARRVPLAYTATNAIDALNGALRWINQQGSFPWMLRKTTAGVTVGTGALALPADFDPGKLAVLYGTASNAVPTEIPFKPWNEAVRQQVTGYLTQGVYSCWSFYATIAAGPPPVVSLAGQVFPITSSATENLQLVYHAISYPPLTSGATTYFPTPDHFDYLIVELAESELMRQQRIAGWDVLWKRVTDQLRALLGAYTTSKIAMAPVTEVVSNANTAQALRAS